MDRVEALARHWCEAFGHDPDTWKRYGRDAEGSVKWELHLASLPDCDHCVPCNCNCHNGGLCGYMECCSRSSGCQHCGQVDRIKDTDHQSSYSHAKQLHTARKRTALTVPADQTVETGPT